MISQHRDIHDPDGQYNGGLHGPASVVPASAAPPCVKCHEGSKDYSVMLQYNNCIVGK